MLETMRLEPGAMHPVGKQSVSLTMGRLNHPNPIHQKTMEIKEDIGYLREAAQAGWRINCLTGAGLFFIDDLVLNSAT